MFVNSNEVYLSIDFEDQSYDLKREFNLNADMNMRVEALHKSVDLIHAFIQNNLKNKQITFFCTGILAHKHPEIIAKISALGHEIGCHYYYHDLVRNDSVATFRINIEKAKDALQRASGKEILGFRAPRFSIDNNDIERFRVIEENFTYDSSLNLNSIKDLQNAYDRLKLTTLRLIPVGQHNVFSPKLLVKTGGTFFKIFPLKIGIKALQGSITNGLQPILYLHPYEFMCDASFKLSWNDLRSLPIMKRMKLYLRQFIWHNFNNNKVDNKLKQVFNQFPDGGKMSYLLK